MSKFTLTTSAILLGAAGILLTFAPELGLAALGVQPSAATLLLGQALGGLYFGFAMLNWMLKDSAMGGIYNRPALIANLSHFVIVCLALLRHLFSGGGHPTPLWALGALYTVLGGLFGLLLFRQPAPAK